MKRSKRTKPALLTVQWIQHFYDTSAILYLHKAITIKLLELNKKRKKENESDRESPNQSKVWYFALYAIWFDFSSHAIKWVKTQKKALTEWCEELRVKTFEVLLYSLVWNSTGKRKTFWCIASIYLFPLFACQVISPGHITFPQNFSSVFWFILYLAA